MPGRAGPYGVQPPSQPPYGAIPGGMPGMPGGMPGTQAYAPYGQIQPQAPDASPPRVEVQLSDPAPYVQQGVMLTLRLLSAGSLAKADPELPAAGPVLIRALGETQA